MKQRIILFLSSLFWMHLAFSQPKVVITGSENSQIVKKQIMQYLEALDVRENIYLIVLFTNDVPDYVEGMTICQHDPEPDTFQIIHVQIDASLSKIRQNLVLAHEMIHVKQFAKGELMVNSKQQVVWKGKYYYKRAYSEQTPWEREAFANDHLLAKQFGREPTIEAPAIFTALDKNP